MQRPPLAFLARIPGIIAAKLRMAFFLSNRFSHLQDVPNF